jgi:hypothetical protein
MRMDTAKETQFRINHAVRAVPKRCEFCQWEPWYCLTDPGDGRHYLAPYPGPQQYCGNCGRLIKQRNTKE